jgi:hypothetical protein
MRADAFETRLKDSSALVRWSFALVLIVLGSLAVLKGSAPHAPRKLSEVGVVLIASALAYLVIAARAGRAGGRRLRIDRSGLSDSLAGQVDWDRVAGVELQWNNIRVGLPAAPPTLVLRLKPGGPRPAERVRILLAGLDRGPEEIEAAARRYFSESTQR